MANKRSTTQEVETNWFFEDKDDELMGIETATYENGGKSKRCRLSDGRYAVSRRLKGDSRKLIERITGGDANKVQDAVVAVSTKIDDKDIVFEDLDKLWYNDLLKVRTMAGSINFL